LIEVLTNEQISLPSLPWFLTERDERVRNGLRVIVVNWGWEHMQTKFSASVDGKSRSTPLDFKEHFSRGMLVNNTIRFDHVWKLFEGNPLSQT